MILSYYYYFFITVAQPVNITNQSDDWKHYNQQHFQREL